MFHYLYRTTNLITKKYYVGMHSTKVKNDGYLGSGLILRHSIDKYGKSVHSVEILETFDSRKSLAVREAEIVTKDLLKDVLCMNLKLGGEGGGCHGRCGNKKGFKHSEETKKKISLNHSKHSYGKPMLPKVKALFDRTGTTHTEEARNKIGAASTKHRSKEWNVIDPLGNVYRVKNLKIFAKDQKLGYTTLLLSTDLGIPISRGKSKGWQVLR